MSLNDTSNYLEGGRSCGVGREEDASNLLWCEHCGIALCFDCDTDLHNSKNSKHGHLRVLLPISRAEAVRKCEHGADGSSHVRPGLIAKPSLPKNKRRASKKERGSSGTSAIEVRRRASSPRNDLPDGCDVGDGVVKKSETTELSLLATSEKAPSSSLKLPRSALRGGSEKAGLGSRPKHHVTWHPDVKEPICTLLSHTVGHKRAPAFLSRRSHQKQLRQKNKSSSKSQARAKKQEKHTKSVPLKAMSDATSDSVEKPVSSDISGSPDDEEVTDPAWSNCTYCIQEGMLSDCVDMSEGSISDSFVQSILLDSGGHAESLINQTAQDFTTVNAVDKKASACDDESFPEKYRQLLASMFHAATSLGQNKAMGSSINYEASSGLFRDVKMHSPGASLSGSEQVFKQATEGKISPWISVV